MRSADDWFEVYGESHQHPTNKIIHWICIPVIMVSLIGLLACLPVPPALPGWAHWGTAFVLFCVGYYAVISRPLALGMAVVAGLLVVAVEGLKGLPVPLWQSSLAVFFAGWVGQFIGHKIEGKKPSVFQDLQFLLIGPMWLLGQLYRAVGVAY